MPKVGKVERCPTCSSSTPSIKAGLAYSVLEPGACPDEWHNQTRNSEVLKSFVAYCQEHPTERFWQALRNWSGRKYILASERFPLDMLRDTFYWEHKDG